MSESELRACLESLVAITKQIVFLVQKNRTACDRPDAHGYVEMMIDVHERLEDLEMRLAG